MFRRSTNTTHSWSAARLYCNTIFFVIYCYCKGKIQFSSLHLATDLNAVTANGNSALHGAAHKGRAEIVALLIHHKAIHGITKDGTTPLMIAAHHGHTECVRMLLAAAKNVNAMDNNGMTALSWAAKNGHERILCLLIEGGAIMNQAGKISPTGKGVRLYFE